jgi:hypothetical protein
LLNFEIGEAVPKWQILEQAQVLFSLNQYSGGVKLP